MSNEIGHVYDCIVIGGGPAGATVGTLLADYGHRTLILERARFPRHHIGESLMPQTYWTLKRLGMLEAMKASDFPRKESVQFVSASGRDSEPYFFTDRDPHEWSVTWQVRRDRFDQMMLDNARQHGAEVREGMGVQEVLFDGRRAVGVRTRASSPSRDGSAARPGSAKHGDDFIGGKVIIDATGTSALLSRQLTMRKPIGELRNAAIYAYFKGARRDEGRNAGATLVIHTPDRSGWFWFIPLPDDITSIGIVAPPGDLCTGRGDNPLATLEEEIVRCPGIRRRLERAERISPAFVTSDFSYYARQIAGDGWVLVGDAYGFLDPIYSSGVFFALTSGEFAAEAIHEALVTGDVSGERLACFRSRLDQGMRYIQELVEFFYDRSFSFSGFNQQHPEYLDHLVRLLIGDVYNDEVADLFPAMRAFRESGAPASVPMPSSSASSEQTRTNTAQQQWHTNPPTSASAPPSGQRATP